MAASCWSTKTRKHVVFHHLSSGWPTFQSRQLTSRARGRRPQYPERSRAGTTLGWRRTRDPLAVMRQRPTSEDVPCLFAYKVGGGDWDPITGGHWRRDHRGRILNPVGIRSFITARHKAGGHTSVDAPTPTFPPLSLHVFYRLSKSKSSEPRPPPPHFSVIIMQMAIFHTILLSCK